MMVQPSDDENTTCLGLFNTAEAFRLSAIALEVAKVNSGHAVKPILFCYYHALELYLKALLRQKHGVEVLRNVFGHNIERLVKEAQALELEVSDEDRNVLSKLNVDAIIEARYIRTGPKSWPQPEELRDTSKRVRDRVGDLLCKAGVPVRL